MRELVEIKKLRDSNNLECKNCPFGYKLDKRPRGQEYLENLCTIDIDGNSLQKFTCFHGNDPRTLKIVKVCEYIEYLDMEIKEAEFKRKKK